MICSLHEPASGAGDNKHQRKTGGHYERPQPAARLTPGAKARSDNEARNRCSRVPRSRHGLDASTRVASKRHLTKIYYKPRQVGRHDGGGRRILERNLYRRSGRPRNQPRSISQEIRHVHAACNDAQHECQQLRAEPVADRFPGPRSFHQRFILSLLRIDRTVDPRTDQLADIGRPSHPRQALVEGASGDSFSATRSEELKIRSRGG
jgi:hypothetical protein